MISLPCRQAAQFLTNLLPPAEFLEPITTTSAFTWLSTNVVIVVCDDAIQCLKRYSSSCSHFTATGHHLPCGITQCHLPPYTSEHAPP